MKTPGLSGAFGCSVAFCLVLQSVGFVWSCWEMPQRKWMSLRRISWSLEPGIELAPHILPSRPLCVADIGHERAQNVTLWNSNRKHLIPALLKWPTEGVRHHAAFLTRSPCPPFTPQSPFSLKQHCTRGQHSPWIIQAEGEMGISEQEHPCGHLNIHENQQENKHQIPGSKNQVLPVPMSECGCVT